MTRVHLARASSSLGDGEAESRWKPEKSVNWSTRSETHRIRGPGRSDDTATADDARPAVART